MSLDISGWSRRVEVVEYARRRGVSVDRAVEELVNDGLSHYRGTPPLLFGSFDSDAYLDAAVEAEDAAEDYDEPPQFDTLEEARGER